jgi:urease accessory protein UreF
MNATVEQSLVEKIRALSPQQVAEVEDFIEFLTSKARKRAALDRLLAIAPALEAAGAEPLTEEDIAAEVAAAREARRARQATKAPGADRS